MISTEKSKNQKTKVLSTSNNNFIKCAHPKPFIILQNQEKQSIITKLSILTQSSKN